MSDHECNKEDLLNGMAKQQDKMATQLDGIYTKFYGNGAGNTGQKGICFDIDRNTGFRLFVQRVAIGILIGVAVVGAGLSFSGCATKAEYWETEKGFKIKCTPMSSCSAKKGDVEITGDGKFNPLKGLINNQKAVL